MHKMKYHDNPPVKPQPEIVIKEVIKEVFIYQPPQIITHEVIKEVQSPHLIEEINRLTGLLAQKDEIIHQMNFEKIELILKLNVGEVSKNTLMDELTGLKEDKIDLRADKARLHEEIALLRKSALIDQEKLCLAEIEIDRIKHELIEFSLLESSIIQENVHFDNQVNGVINNQPHNPLIAGNTVHSILLSQEESVVLGDSIGSNLDDL